MKKITTQIKFIGGILSLIIIAIVMITAYINYASKQDSIVINIAGKQRMLTQKMTKEAFWLQHRLSNEYDALDAAMNDFNQSINDLRHGNAKRGIYAPPKQCIAERLDQVYLLWEKFSISLNDFKRLLLETTDLKSLMPHKNSQILEISDDVVKLMVKENLQGSIIDDAGRQRMLTQKIAFYSSQYLITGRSEYITDFFQAYGLYASTLEIFIKDKTLMLSPTLKKILQNNKQIWQDYANYIIKIMDKQKNLNETLLQIKHNNVIILDMMDSAVGAYTVYSEQQRELLQNFQYGASFIALLFMLYSARLTKKIEENFADFLKHSEAIATSLEDVNSIGEFNNEHSTFNNDELTIASMHMRHFVDKMNTVIQHAQQAINESEYAAKELAIVSEQIDDNLVGLELDDEAKKEIDTSEDIVIQTLEELSNTSALLNKLQKNLNSVVAKTQHK